MNIVYVLFFAGVAAGAVLCPLFLPVPEGNRANLHLRREVPHVMARSHAGKNKSLILSLGFIAFLISFECAFRSMGIDVWLGSAAVRGVMAVPEGIITTMCYGLFYLTWQPERAVSGQARRPARRPVRTSRFSSLVLGVVLLGSVLVRYYFVPLIGAGIVAVDPIKGAAFVFNVIKWHMVVLGISAAASVSLRHIASASPDGVPDGVPSAVPHGLHNGPHEAAPEGTPLDVPAFNTNWPVILRLIGLASVFTILNAALDMRALPLYSNTAIYHPHYITVAVIVCILGFFAGRSTASFIRRFTFPAVIMFILFSCLPLFENKPQINMVMSTLISIGHYTAWIVFTTAIVELYAGGFWFYGASSVIFFTVFFAFLAPVIGPFLPDGTEYQVMYIVLSAVLFMLLTFRWLVFPKFPYSAAQQKGSPSAAIFEKSNIGHIFNERGLSYREIEIAYLLVKEGLGKDEIGERLSITPGTVKIHISNIYQKFKVKNRAEFMALFVKVEKL